MSPSVYSTWYTFCGLSHSSGVGRRVQVGNVLGDHDALGILPGSLADAILRIHRGRAIGGLGREIGVPGLGSAGARGLRQRLAVIVGTRKAAEVGAVADTVAGDEEAGVGRLRLRR